MNNTITIQTIVKTPIEKVWEYWTETKHISNWAASGEWEASAKSNDLRVGGTFNTRMQAKDGSAGFDFVGEYTTVVPHERIEYTMDDDRKVKVVFEKVSEGVKIVESFEAEKENSEEVQKEGWQGILDNFKKYAEKQ